jgi:uridine kinase
MARRVVRDYKDSSVENIMSEMKNYIFHGRRGYLEMLKTIKPNSDIIVDGTLPVSHIVSIIIEKIKQTSRLL